MRDRGGTRDDSWVGAGGAGVSWEAQDRPHQRVDLCVTDGEWDADPELSARGWSLRGSGTQC